MKYSFFMLVFLSNHVVYAQYIVQPPGVKQMAAGTGHGMALLVDGTVLFNTISKKPNNQKLKFPLWYSEL